MNLLKIAGPAFLHRKVYQNVRTFQTTSNSPPGMEEDCKHPKPGHGHPGPIPEAVAAETE